MLETERYILEFDTTHGAADTAVGLMLSDCVMNSVKFGSGLSLTTLTSLQKDYDLKLSDIENLANTLLDALEDSDLYLRVLGREQDLNSVTCMVKRNIAWLELEWT